MTLGTIFVIIFISLALNILVTSFLIARFNTSKKLSDKLEISILLLLENVNKATNKQIILAEDNIKKLKLENKKAKEIYSKLLLIPSDSYKMLMEIIQNVERKKLASILLPTQNNISPDPLQSTASTTNHKVKHSCKNSNATAITHTDVLQKQQEGIDYASLSRDEIDLLTLIFM